MARHSSGWSSVRVHATASQCGGARPRRGGCYLCALSASARSTSNNSRCTRSTAQLTVHTAVKGVSSRAVLHTAAVWVVGRAGQQLHTAVKGLSSRAVLHTAAVWVGGRAGQRLHTAVKGVSSRAPPLACKKRVSCPACEGLRVSLACVTRHRPSLGSPPHRAGRDCRSGRGCGPGQRGASEVVGQMPDSLSCDTLTARPTSTSRHRRVLCLYIYPSTGRSSSPSICMCIPLL